MKKMHEKVLEKFGNEMIRHDALKASEQIN